MRRAHLMKSKILLIGVFLLLAPLTSAWAADLLGNWIVKGSSLMLADKDGFRQALGETVFSFKVNGTELTGKVSDPQGETAIREGKINGDEISFVVIRSDGGNEKKLAYKGQVSLNEIRFTLEVQDLKGQPLEFIAKREFPRHGDIPLQIAVPVEHPPVREKGKIRIPDK
jgi:hypothetical protein